MNETTDNREVQCPCCLGEGQVISTEGVVQCPICEGDKTVPEEVAHRFLELGIKRLPGREIG
jgi:DnaJ-class molecular chaperone